MRTETRDLGKGLLSILLFLGVALLAVNLGGCVGTVRVMSDQQFKSERLDRITWNGSDTDNTLRGAQALEDWRIANDSPLAE